MRRHLYAMMCVMAGLASGPWLVACRQAPRPGADDRVAAPTASSVPAQDRALTDTARVLAGVSPAEPGALSSVTDRKAWRDYQASIDTKWARERAGRFQLIARWRDREVPAQVAACRVLFYPFGGPDILHALLFFPRCERYVLFGLEHLGSVPRLSILPGGRVDRLIADLQAAMADLFTRHYFITKDMMGELSGRDLDGVTPLLLVQLARLDARIVSVDRVRLVGTGEVGPVGDAAEQVGGSARTTGAPQAPPLIGTRIVFIGPDGDRPQEVVYFRGQAENEGLQRQPDIESYLRHLRPATTLLKSASYLLHTPAFSGMRGVILDVSSVILEDDSGVPYHFLTTPAWRLTLYGRYARPIADFHYGFQRDLEAAYDAAPVRPLPFSFGYHWRDGRWGVLLAERVGTR